jgi:ABC-type dipeptide/oligopeptide/nickel transport system ATPase component
VDDISFTLKAGETLGLVGESGCGKTTTCLSIVGLLPSAARIAGGRVRITDLPSGLVTRYSQLPSAGETINRPAHRNSDSPEYWLAGDALRGPDEDPKKDAQ